MAIKIGSNFSFQGQQPNFERDSFTTKAAMKAFPETSIDDGHLSYCEADGNMYQFKSSNTVDATTGKWRVFRPVDGLLSNSSTNAVQNKVVFGALGLKADASALQSYLTKTSAEGTYAKKTDISNVYKYKGSVTDSSKLPTTGQTTGDVYNIETAGGGYKAGDNVAWNGAAWDNLSGIVDLSAYATTNAMNTALANKVDKITGKGLSTEDYTTADKTKLGKAFTTDTVSSEPNQFLAGPATTKGNLHLRKIDSSDLPTMGAASASAAGKAGIVPAPGAGKQGSFLRGDGKWESPTFTVPTASTTTLGGVKVGTNLSATADGTLSVTTDANVTEGSTKPITSGAVAALNKNIQTVIKAVSGKTDSVTTSFNTYSGTTNTKISRIETTLGQKANTSALNNYVPKTSTSNVDIVAPAITIGPDKSTVYIDINEAATSFDRNGNTIMVSADDGISLNTVSNQTVTINGKTVAVLDDITNVYKYKGSVTDSSKLPTTGRTTGDVYNIETAGGGYKAGDNVAWNGTAWDNLSGIVDLSAYATTSAMNTKLASYATNTSVDTKLGKKADVTTTNAISNDVTTLMNKVFPFTVTVSLDKTLGKKGTSQPVKLTITAKKGDDVSQVDGITINGTKYTGNIPYTYSATATTTTTYNVTVKKGSQTASKPATITFFNPSYDGSVAASKTSLSETEVKALTETLRSGKGGTRTFNLTNQKACIAYPKAFGAAASIKDANGFDYLASYDKTELNVNGELYYVYLMKNATTITGMGQTVG